MNNHFMTKFEEDWGMSAYDFALQEGVSVEAIHMRIYKFGTPYQRKKSPTRWEKKYSKTANELSVLLNLHPSTMDTREKKYGNVYYQTQTKKSGRKADQTYRQKMPNWGLDSWLHPQHPDYTKWRNGELFPDDFVG